MSNPVFSGGGIICLSSAELTLTVVKVYIYVCMCVYVCVCVYVHVCSGAQISAG